MRNNTNQRVRSIVSNVEFQVDVWQRLVVLSSFATSSMMGAILVIQDPDPDVIALPNAARIALVALFGVWGLTIAGFGLWRASCARRFVEAETDPSMLELLPKARALPEVARCLEEVQALKRPINRGEAAMIARLYSGALQ